MTSNSDNAELDHIRALFSCRAFSDGVQYITSLSPSLQAQHSHQLWLIRMYNGQGLYKEAREILAQVDMTSAPNLGLAAIFQLESCTLHIMEAKVQQGLDNARAIYKDASQSLRGCSSEWTEVQRLYARIVLMARVYSHVPSSEQEEVRRLLDSIIPNLLESGMVEEAMLAMFTRASSIDNVEERVRAYRDIEHVVVAQDPATWAIQASLERIQLMEQLGNSPSDVQNELDAIRSVAERSHDQYTCLEVEYVKAQLAVSAATPDALEALEACYRQFETAGLFRGALLVLSRLNGVAAIRGDRTLAMRSHRLAAQLIDRTGCTLMLGRNIISEIHFLQQFENGLSQSIELCHAALAKLQLNPEKALVYQMLAIAYSRLNRYQDAVTADLKACEMFHAHGAVGMESNAVYQYAEHLRSTATPQSLQEAIDWLQLWIPRDRTDQCWGNAVAKLDLLAYLQVELATSRHGRLPDDTELALNTATELVKQMPVYTQSINFGKIAQTRGRLKLQVGDATGVQDLKDAICHYQRGNHSVQIAYCHSEVGIAVKKMVRMANDSSFQYVEEQWRQAEEYFQRNGMLAQLAEITYLRAEMMVNFYQTADPPMKAHMLLNSLALLTTCRESYDLIRQEFLIDSTVGTFAAKRSLAKNSPRVYQLAIKILCKLLPSIRTDFADLEQAWDWVQRSKSRAFADLLGSGTVIPHRIMDNLRQSPQSLALVEREQALARQVETMSPSERLRMRAESLQLRRDMEADAALRDYRQFRSGATFALDELKTGLGPEVVGEKGCVCLDWFTVDGQLYLFSATVTADTIGRPILRMFPLEISMAQIRSFVKDHLSPDYFRDTMRSTWLLDSELHAIVDKLPEITQTDQLLIFSPVQSLHAVPLHALTVVQETGSSVRTSVVERNPVIYCSSLSILRQCLSRQRAGRPTLTRPVISFLADSLNDRPETARTAFGLSEQLRQPPPLVADKVTKETVKQALRSSDIFHYQGHAIYDRQDVWQSSLLLADGSFTVRDIFETQDIRAKFVTLGACEGANMLVESDEEPVGIIPAFLYSGADTVVASLWPVTEATAGLVMQSFYTHLQESWARGAFHPAQSFRSAILRTKLDSTCSTPRHWASFIMHGC